MSTAFRAVSSLLSIEIASQPLPVDVEPLLVRSYVDDHVGLPDAFMLEFRDPAHDVISRIGAHVGDEVTLSVVTSEDSTDDKLLVGEITALETEFDATGSRTFIRGYDKSHRLMRGRTTTSWTNVTVADVVRQVADRAGIDSGTISDTDGVFDHVAQPNVSDWELLRSLARSAGCKVAVRDGKLNFTKPGDSDDGPDTGDPDSTNPLQLTPATNLLRFRATVTSAEQPHEVRVRGWDVNAKHSVEGIGQVDTDMATIGTSAKTLADTFGSPVLTSVTTPHGTQAEVDAAAKALGQRAAARFATLEGVAVGSSKLRAGSAVSLGLAGDPFEGKYTLSTTRHRFDSDEGYTTSFTVSGEEDDTLVGLLGAASGGGAGASTHVGRFEGVVPAKVTDARDPDNQGRVKLSFPWLSDQYESFWARVVQAGAGSNRGTVVLPEVDDEVLVAFEHGSIERPYVIGGLYNGKDMPPLGDNLVDGSSGAVNRRGFISKKGSALVFVDRDDSEGIALMSSDRTLRISLNQTKTIVSINSSGQVKIEGDQDISIKAGTSLALEAGTSLSIKAGSTLELEGAQVKVSGDGEVAVQGSIVKLN